MKMDPPAPGTHGDDVPLWHTAVQLLSRTYRHERHEVAAALRTRSGNVFTGVHLAGSAGRSSICAEGIALGAALAGGDLDVDTVVAVLYRPRLPRGTVRAIAPCGVCRELLYDYCPDASVYLHEAATPTPTPAATPNAPGPVLARSPAEVGFAGAVLAPGTVRRVPVASLLPGKNPRRW
jgi:cytidine deaminase